MFNSNTANISVILICIKDVPLLTFTKLRTYSYKKHVPLKNVMKASKFMFQMHHSNTGTKSNLFDNATGIILTASRSIH